MGGGPVDNIEALRLCLRDVSVSQLAAEATNAKVRARLYASFARVSLNLQFSLPSDREIDGEFLFPIVPEAAVTAFKFRLGDEDWREASLHERAEAEAKYRQAVKANRAPVLGTTSTGKDVTRIQLGYLPAGVKCEVQVEFVEPLSFSACDDMDDIFGSEGSSPAVKTAKVRWILPTRLAPRFEETVSGVKVDSADGGLRISVAWDGSTGVTGLSCTSHDKTPGWMCSHSSETECRWHGACLGGDFVVEGCLPRPETPRLVVEYNALTETHAALLTMVPSFEHFQTTMEVIFVVDRSGSMAEGGRMEQASLALQTLLRSLPPTSYFNVVSFGSRASTLFEQGSRALTSDTLVTGLTHCGTMRADLGGTNLHLALQAATTLPEIPNVSRRVLLITDGLVGEHIVDQVCSDIQVWVGAADRRVFSLGVGPDVSRALISGVARAGHGDARFSDNVTRLASDMVGLLTEALRPCVSNVSVRWKTDPGPGTSVVAESQMAEEMVEETSWFSSPDRVTSVPIWPSPRPGCAVAMSGRHFVCFCLVPADGPVTGATVSAQVAGKTMVSSVEASGVVQGRDVHAMAVRSLVADVLQGSSFLTHAIPPEASLDLGVAQAKTLRPLSWIEANREALKLSLAHSVSSSLTSWLVSSTIERAESVGEAEERGRILDAKEAFRTLSYQFHGRAPTNASDPAGLTTEEQSMLSEARARLANTAGKKAKRKARERVLRSSTADEDPTQTIQRLRASSRQQYLKNRESHLTEKLTEELGDEMSLVGETETSTEAFGRAMLRGMGWLPPQRDLPPEPALFRARPGAVGLGGCGYMSQKNRDAVFMQKYYHPGKFFADAKYESRPPTLPDVTERATKRTLAVTEEWEVKQLAPSGVTSGDLRPEESGQLCLSSPNASPLAVTPERHAETSPASEWKIPPCISNWKNDRGFTVPLDKRVDSASPHIPSGGAAMSLKPAQSQYSYTQNSNLVLNKYHPPDFDLTKSPEVNRAASQTPLTRKVLNKYFPPDFDPSILPPKPHRRRVAIRADTTCLQCGTVQYAGRVFNAVVRDNGTLSYRCPVCSWPMEGNPQITPAPPGSILENILSFQTFDGRFPPSERLVELVGMPWPLEKRCAVLFEDDVWMTALVLVVLQTKHVAQKDEWTLIARKAANFIRCSVQGDAFDSLIRSARAALVK